MKKLLAILLLCITPAFAQEYAPSVTYDPTVVQTYTATQTTTTQLDNIKQTGGTPLTLYDDGTTFQPIQLQFDFYFFGSLFNSVYISQNGFISFSSNANGCCSGNQLPYLSNESYFNVNNSIFALWSDLADFNTPGNPYYKSTGNSFTVGWYGVDELATQNKFDFEIKLFSDSSFSINYGNFDYNGITGRTFTSGFQGDTQNEYYTIYYGNDPSILENQSYLFTSTIEQPPPEQPIAVDCATDPYNPTCIIQDLTTFTDEELLVEDTTGDDGTEVVEEEEETFVADETKLEEMLQDKETTEEVMVAEINEREILYRELTDEEKAQILADSISKNTLEFALSVSESATAAIATTTTETTTTMTRSLVNNSDDKSDEKVTDTNENKEQVADNTDSASDLLETGRSMGAAALSATMSQTEQSATDSSNQAENIAMDSSETKGSDAVIENISIQNVFDTNVTASVSTSDFENNIVENKTETIVEETVANVVEQSTNEIQNIDSFADIMNIDIKPTDSTVDDVEFVQSILANISQSNNDSNTNTFNEDEQVTIQNDPNLSNAFNVIPNTNNLEILGVLGNKQEEKSDAEKRADQAIAANKEQQEEINKNYMDADQSGIVAAMSGDTDVSSYRSAMLRDNNVWYKPEDIYKNVVYKDNARGMYFLEKGNTDTYKKMVDEQYK